MVKEPRNLTISGVHRVMQVKPGIYVEKEAIMYMKKKAENMIRDDTLNAIPFMEYRKGTMICLRDIQAAEKLLKKN